MNGFLWAAAAVAVLAIGGGSCFAVYVGRTSTNPDDWSALIGGGAIAVVLLVIAIVLAVIGLAVKLF